MFKKKNKYDIIVTLEESLQVQKFAVKHSTAKTGICVRAYGNLLGDGKNFTRVSFESYEEPAMIYSDLIQEFLNGHKLAIRRHLVFITKENES